MAALLLGELPSPLPLAGEVATRSVAGGGSLRSEVLARGSPHPTPPLPRKRERGRSFRAATYSI
ncbi:hypothetical protein CO675_20355 [Bradyrhizobium sp. C9]|nr:hypothetical protein CO675_20355 [Bradyrhizobium sp. C9]